LSLQSTGGPSPVTVSQNEAGLSSDVSNFVNAYNQLISQINSDTQAQPNTTAPPLAANGGLESAAEGLQFALGTINLSTLGISIDSQTGALQFNASNFASEFQSNPSQVTSAMAAVYQALNGQVTDALNPSTGVIAAQTNSINSQITSLNQQISTISNQIQQEETQLQSEYASIQASVSTYQNLSLLLSEESGGSGSSSSGSTSAAPGSNLTIDS
jgi:flagellar hook-associated protein 2